MKLMLVYVHNICKRSNISSDRNTNQVQVPRNVFSPTPPHPPQPHCTMTQTYLAQHQDNIKVYGSKKRQPFWGGESADSLQLQL